VLDAAVEVIADHGLEGVTHRAVARAAEVPLSTTSYFFGSLDELVGAAVTRIADGVLADVDSLLTDAAGMAATSSIDGYIDRFVDIITAPRARQILVQFEAYLGSTRRVELVEPVQRIVQAYESAATTVLGALGATDPERAGRHLVAVLDGFAINRLAHPRPDDHELLREAVQLVAAAHLGVPLTRAS